MTDRYSYYAAQLQQLKHEGIQRSLPPLRLEGKYVVQEGQRLLNLSGNNYLGIHAHEFLPTFPAESYAWSASSSRLLTGNDSPYPHFEEYLASCYGAESALLWGSGYHANSGWIPTLASDGHTLILADRLVHASIVEGIRLSKAPFMRFRHNDISHLTTLLEQHASQYDSVWIITEALFSMDGDFAPLAEIVLLKQRYPHLYLYVDEAHSVGVYGPNGLGYTAACGLLPQVDLLVGTLGKALGSAGAFTLQPRLLRDLAVSTARPLIYSTALPPVVVAWSEHLFRAMQEMDDRRTHLQLLQQVMRERLGLPVTSQILPIPTPGNEYAAEVATALVEAGYYVRPIRRPTVPKGSERLRLSLTADMTTAELQAFCDILTPLLHL